MGATELLLGGHRRAVGNHEVKQALDQQVVVNGRQPFRAFGVVGAHLVADAIGVCDVGAEQIRLPKGLRQGIRIV